MKDILRILLVVVGFLLAYFFSFQIQGLIAKLSAKATAKLGVFVVDKEYDIQRYMYMHRTSLITKCYKWLNQQVINLGYKRYGVTPLGYLCFWCIVDIFITLGVQWGLAFSLKTLPIIYFLLLFVILMLTRVYIAERMERREADIMDTEDLLIPEMSKGFTNVVSAYIDKIPSGIRADFRGFLENKSNRNIPFDKAIIILSDSLGGIFEDFAQKVMYYERLGEDDLLDIFEDIVEQNRRRRQLRNKNNQIFRESKQAFIIVSCLSMFYGGYTIWTDEFSHKFFTVNPLGKAVLFAMLLLIVSVLCYITTVKSKKI